MGSQECYLLNTYSASNSYYMRTLVCIVITYVGFSCPAFSQSPDKFIWKDFKINNYQIEIPSNWVVESSKTNSTLFQIFAPRETSNDFYQENLTLVVHDVSQLSVDLDMYAEMLLQEYKKRLNAVSLIQNKRVNSGDLDYQYLRYIGKDGHTQILLDQYVWLNKGEALILTFSSEASKHYAYKFIGKKMLNSFSFIAD